MPFQSEKQRKYLWANEPAIAKRWEKYPKGYNTGGVSHLFRSKEDRVGFNAGSWRGNPGTDSRKEVRDAWKDFLGYRKKGGDKNWQKYMPIWIGANLAHGGYVRPEEDGVLGLADGGQLVKPGPGRPGYGGPHETWGGGAEAGRDPDPPSHSDDGNDGNDHGAGNPDQFNMTPPAQNFPDWESGSAENTWATMSDEMAEKSKAETERVLGDHGDPMGNPDEQAKYARYVKYTLKDQVKKEDSELVKFLKFMGKTAAVVGTGGTALGFGNLGVVKLATAVDKAYKLSNTFVTGYNLFNKTDYTKTELWNKIQEEAKLAKELEKKSAGLGGEEFKRLTYADQLKLLQFRDKDEQDGDGDKTTTTEDVSKDPTKEEMIAASLRALQMLYGDRRSAQIPEDRSKQMAYYNAYKNKYMSAKGGRVPGYNTGGLSSLFRLKNK